MRAPDRLTPSQTVGPFFTLGLNQSAPHESNRSPVSNVITGDGKKISIIGKVMDGNHDPVVDALIEIWQADSTGKFNNPHFLVSLAATQVSTRNKNFCSIPLNQDQIVNMLPLIYVP